MRYEERPPCAELRPHLECLWLVSDPRTRSRRAPDRVVPDGCPELIVHLGDPFARKIGARWVVQPRVFLAATLTRPWLLRAGRRVRTLGIRFRPAEVAALLPLSLAGAADRELPLAELLGLEAERALVDGVRGLPLEPAFAAAEAWVLERRRPGRARRPSARRAVAQILKARGAQRIAELARTLGWSRRRLERAFDHDLGVPPKLFARIVRLNAVLSQLDESERPRAVDVALDAGYFDQAHLLRDFRSLAGRTPRAGSQADGPLARHFTRPERLRALLAGE